ncbi:MAG: methyltransferase [Burkholderiaceae bacterium]|nr:methyltransferase [Burkholderiaceae bacterium]
MKAITSRENAQYKELKRLAGSAQARRKAGQTLLDGVHLCDAYLATHGRPQQCLVGESASMLPEVADIVARCEALAASCVLLPDALFKPLSQVENGVDLLFLIDTPAPQLPQKLTQSAVLLDAVQDPGNLGSILRSAAAAGITQVFCSPGTAQAWSPRVLRAGMGAHFLLQVFENVDLAQLIRTSAVPVLATSPHTTQTVYQADLRQPLAWLFGHEGQGVSDELMALATLKVAIPQPGAMESLNVAASAAVCLFEQVRQNN